jgi:hypothetical protein
MSVRKAVMYSVACASVSVVVAALIAVPSDQPWARLATVLCAFPVSAFIIVWFFWNRERVRRFDEATGGRDQ